MSEKYKMREKDKAYFVTITVVDWLFAFTRHDHKMILVKSLKYCIENKGLEIYDWCLMSNHLHMIVKAAGEPTLSEILRDFKKYTARAMIRSILGEPEGREKRMLMLNYIHQNPVKAKLVVNPENYYFSSARNYAGLDFLLPVVVETVELKSR